MVTKDEIIGAIRQTPLSSDDLSEIIVAATSVMVGNTFLDAGMDLLGLGARDGQEAEGKTQAQ